MDSVQRKVLSEKQILEEWEKGEEKATHATKTGKSVGISITKSQTLVQHLLEKN